MKQYTNVQRDAAAWDFFGPSETGEEKAKRLGVPYIPPREVPTKVDANPVIAICGGCNREVRKVESYSCNRENCPIQPKVSM